MKGQTRANPKQKPLKPVYLIYGDGKIIEEALLRLKKRISAQFDLDFNFDQFNGGSSSAGEIVQAANTLPFLSDKRLVIVKEVEKFAAEDVAQLTKYVENPCETTCLVLVAGSVNKAGKLYKAVIRTGEAAEYKLKESPLSWIKKQFGDRGKLVSDSLARYLLHVVGHDLQKLSIEIEKISLYHDGDRIVDPEEIELVVSKSTEMSVFDLVDSIGQRNAHKSIEALRLILNHKEAPLGILNLIARHFRLLLRVKVWVEEDRDNKYIIENLAGDGGSKLPFFVVAKYREQAHNFSIKELREVFDRLLEADILLKSSMQPPEAILEELIIKLVV